MNATRALRPDVTAYLDDVRSALADLPDDERDDLLSEVEASLAEAAEESDRPLATRLGPPEAFAAELRSAAGLQVPSAPPGRESRAVRVTRALERMVADPRLARIRSLYLELAPIWWALRGYVAVAVLALITSRAWTDRFVPHLPRARWGAAAIILAVIVSIALGLRTRRAGSAGARRNAVATVALNIVLAIAVVPVLVHLLQTPRVPVIVEMVASPAYDRGLTLNGVPVDNIYPYSRDGRLLHDVLLYTGSKKPLDIRSVVPDPQRRVPVSRSGKRIYNAFPIRYFERGTRTVAHPNAAPRISLPRLLTPPLTRPREQAHKQKSGSHPARARVR